MGARLRVFLTREQDKTLLRLRCEDVPQKVKDRAEVIRLNAHGWYVEKIAAHFNWTPQTVREVLHKWQKLGVEALWEKPGRGGKTKYKEEDIVFLEECLKKDELSGQMFDDELDLAYAVMNGVKARGERGKHSTQRMKFNSYPQL